MSLLRVKRPVIVSFLAQVPWSWLGLSDCKLCNPTNPFPFPYEGLDDGVIFLMKMIGQTLFLLIFSSRRLFIYIASYYFWLEHPLSCSSSFIFVDPYEMHESQTGKLIKPTWCIRNCKSMNVIIKPKWSTIIYVIRP